MSLADDTAASITAAAHLGDADLAAVNVAMRLAMFIDALFDSGDTDGLAKLVPKYQAALVELQLTPASRKQGDLQEGRTGHDHIEGYLRLIHPQTGHPSVRPPERGGSGRKPSK
jgi:hypothetical protein